MTGTNRRVVAQVRRTILLVLIPTCLIGLALIGLWLIGSRSPERSELAPAGQELSTVEGVSIVRIPPSRSRSSSSGAGVAEAHIDAEGIDLLTCLGEVSGNQDPIIVLTDLPAGQFRILARTESGGRDELRRRVCLAFSEAFGCNVTRRRIEIDVEILHCRNRQSLLLADGTAEQGFYQHEEMPKGVRRTHFCSTLDNVASFAGSMARVLAAQNDVPNRQVLLRKAYVNETGLPGFFQGTLDWDVSDPLVIRSSLTRLGFELTTGRRTIPALVVEPRTPGQEWTYLSDSGQERDARGSGR
jgi:hypothetical protein